MHIIIQTDDIYQDFTRNLFTLIECKIDHDTAFMKVAEGVLKKDSAEIPITAPEFSNALDLGNYERYVDRLAHAIHARLKKLKIERVEEFSLKMLHGDLVLVYNK